jgi:hypothetical protein
MCELAHTSWKANGTHHVVHDPAPFCTAMETAYSGGAEVRLPRRKADTDARGFRKQGRPLRGRLCHARKPHAGSESADGQCSCFVISPQLRKNVSNSKRFTLAC